VYLDWNATAPPLEAALRAMADASKNAWANPASVHRFGRAARARVEDAREAVATLGRCDARDVVITSGGTESNNIALCSAFPVEQRRSRSGRVKLLVTSRLEHASVVHVAEALERGGRARIRWIRARLDGTIDLDDLEHALSEGNVGLVAVQAVNHETGVVQPIATVRELSARAGASLHVDTVQAFGRALEVAEEADTRSLAAHKIRGPKSIGALIARGSCRSLGAVLYGGSQERGVRPGTVDPIAAAGLEVAARHAITSPVRYELLAPLRDRLEASLLEQASGASVNGGAAQRMPHVTNISFPGWSGAELVAALDLEGVAVSSGSACSAGTADASPVLDAMGGRARAASSVRFSLGEETTPEDIDVAVEAVGRVLGRLRSGGD
jgi:cysteine desulfurase